MTNSTGPRATGAWSCALCDSSARYWVSTSQYGKTIHHSCVDHALAFVEAGCFVSPFGPHAVGQAPRAVSADDVRRAVAVFSAHNRVSNYERGRE